ncbi:tRNA (guanosine(46)-N7)-methyltransferase TrmB [Thiotrichales bacterium HSG1]|nr:tRNA (guanosine(46)-N7)-methyltransferase TrmB [Thiotrichales bacterium HSG1]
MSIRSFVQRGRITSSQRKAIKKLWPYYGVELTSELDLNTLFGRSNNKHLEIGFGNGDALIAMAKSHPEYDYIGVDVYTPGVGKVLINIETSQLTNVKIMQADAVEILNNNLLSSCLDAVYIFFPDPWPKRCHHKRRLIQTNFINLLAKCIKSNGKLHLATDWEHYAQHMLSVLEASPKFINHTNGFSQRPLERPVTKFEKRGLRMGHGVWDLMYRRC